MMGAIWAFIKAAAAALGWAKQASDQKDGADLLRGKDNAATLDLTGAIHNSRLDPGNIHSVHSRSRASD